jgi:hypothetical protein
MSKNQSLGLYPGGFEEATITSQKKNKVYLKNRKGFIKYALKYGYTVYPAFTFGENKVYWVFEPFEKLRLFMNKFKTPAVFCLTKLGFLPDYK